LAVYTDSPDYAEALLPEALASELTPTAETGSTPGLVRTLLRPEKGLHAAPGDVSSWRHLLLTDFAPESNYDGLIGLARGPGVPDRVASLAGAGRGFHGFKGRAWAAQQGNIHLSVHLTPLRPVERFEVAFTVLAALSMAEAVDGVEGLETEARIKWVNDIVLDGAKVGGVLAYTQTRGEAVSSAVLGLGLNVESAPSLPPTPFVPRTTRVRDFLAAGEGPANLQREVFLALLTALERNYGTLLEEGYGPLLERYRSRSVVLGREVTIFPEDADEISTALARGRVVAMGEGLELYVDGQTTPLPRGRLVLEEEAEPSAEGASDDTSEFSAPLLVGGTIRD
jgi:BirA family biotin operon repressor/biotin-[acetyl-CoA-carboxylase] ligase